MQPADLALPSDYTIVAGADTGTFMSGLIAAVSPDLSLFALEEFPNYQYAGGEIELTGMTTREWMVWFGSRLRHYTKRHRNVAWVDGNTTFIGEISHELSLMRNHIHLEVRTAILREYAKANAVHLMPWLRVLPYELERAHWPDSFTTARYVRVKEFDHTLDCLEHIASRRPRSKAHLTERPKTLKEQLFEQFKTPQVGRPLVDPHLGPG